MTKIKELLKGDIVRLENGHEVMVENIILNLEWYDDVAKVIDVSTGQQGLLYDRDEFEKVRDYSVEDE